MAPSDVEVEKQAATATHTEANRDELANSIEAEDHETSKLRCIKQNPWAFFWACYGAWQIMLLAYENNAAGLVTGIPRFRCDFGYPTETGGSCVLPAAWQAAHSGGPIAAQVLRRNHDTVSDQTSQVSAALFSGQIADWIGRKKTFAIAFSICLASTTIQVLSTNNPMFFAGKFLNGFAIGTLKACAATYIGEVTPLPLRGLMTVTISMGYSLGGFVVALVLNSTGTFESRWAYRAVFVSQYGVAGVSVILLFFAPESPWWLVSKGRNEDALKSLRRLGHTGGREDRRLADIQRTLDSISHETVSVSYLECFRKSNLRRTMISVMPMISQSAAGVVFMVSYTLYYAQLAGFSNNMSFRIQVTTNVLAIVGNIASWFLIDRMGRRQLMLWGLFSLVCVLMVMGGLAVVDSQQALVGAVTMCLLFSLFYNVGIGAAAFTIATETATARLRVKTIAVGLSLQASLNTAWSFSIPYLLNPDRLNLGGKIGFIFGSVSVLVMVYLFFCQPETRGRSYAELDEMFMKKLPARQFKKYTTDIHQDAARTNGDDAAEATR